MKKNLITLKVLKVESGDHIKNGATPKSLMSRNNKIK